MILPTERPGLLYNKAYLYLTEFFAGMSVMAVELGASRLLAPYFSSSQIVWTIIIGTIMIAMALGNIYGGRSADKNPDPEKLYGRMLIASVWIAAIPLIGKFIIVAVSAIFIITISTNLLIWAAFTACMVIFVFPLFLLGTVTPSLVKYTVDNLEDNGKTVGFLNAANTIGSIIGTFVPTFISIPAVGTSMTFLIFSGILLLLALLYFASCRKGLTKCLVALILYGIFFFGSRLIGFAFWEHSLAYEGESIYNYLQVRENDRMTVLSTNVLFGVQSVYMKSGGLTGMYYDYALAAPFMTENMDEAKDILVLGMGSGTFARQCRLYLPQPHIEGVEIDEKITELARRYFDLPATIDVQTYDGRAYLNAADKKYDVIMVDAYQDITIPFQMSSVEFFTLVRDHLKTGGVMVVNMNMKSDKADSINAWLGDTIASVFQQVYTADVSNATNKELFAANDTVLLNVLAENLRALAPGELRTQLEAVASRLTVYEPGERILTDDQAPVELLGMRVIDDLISSELEYYKEIYRIKGLKGFLDATL